MSRTGIKRQIITPDKECINCRYWSDAQASRGFYLGSAGRCTAGYCKKRAIQPGRDKRR